MICIYRFLILRLCLFSHKIRFINLDIFMVSAMIFKYMESRVLYNLVPLPRMVVVACCFFAFNAQSKSEEWQAHTSTSPASFCFSAGRIAASAPAIRPYYYCAFICFELMPQLWRPNILSCNQKNLECNSATLFLNQIFYAFANLRRESHIQEYKCRPSVFVHLKPGMISTLLIWYNNLKEIFFIK
jgi:hypothetical protein